jgi:hypothetical protein
MAFAHYGADGRATFRLPTGTILRGVWSLKDDHYCADWENGPRNSCTKLIRMPGSVLMVDLATESEEITRLCRARKSRDARRDTSQPWRSAHVSPRAHGSLDYGNAD